MKLSHHLLACVVAVGLFTPMQRSASLAQDLTPQQRRQQALDILFGKLHQATPGNPSAAEVKIWEEWTASESPTADLLLRQANVALNDQEPQIAVTLLSGLLKRHPNYAEVWNRRAIAYVLLQQDDKALADLMQAVKLEPRHFAAWAGIGLIYQRQRKWQQAAEAYKMALTINPAMLGVKAALHEVGQHERDI